MTRQQIFLEQACRQLGLNIVAPFLLTLPQGARIKAQALIRQLGAPNGMIVVSDYGDLNGMARAIEHEGYGYSVMSGPSPAEEFDLEVYREVFADWGWAGPDEDKPGWMS